MLTSEHDDYNFRVYYRSYVFALALLIVPPLMIYHLGGSLLDGSIDRSNFVGLILGILMPLAGSYYLFEIGSFSFSTETNLFMVNP